MWRPEECTNMHNLRCDAHADHKKAKIAVTANSKRAEQKCFKCSHSGHVKKDKKVQRGNTNGGNSGKSTSTNTTTNVHYTGKRVTRY